MNRQISFLFLYEELAGYFLSCIRTLSSDYEVSVHVVHRKINPDAPFNFKFPEGVRFYSQEDYTQGQLIDLIRTIKPDAVYCGGWRNKKYLKCAEYLRKNSIPVILGFDNKWNGKLKQIILSLAIRPLFRRYFSHAFVAGESQRIFARKLGFPSNKIRTGVYCADDILFGSVWKLTREQKKNNFPHRFIYTGRYSSEKGIELLWEAFISATENENSDWELWCVGTGSLHPITHPRIKHFGFVQPEQLKDLLAQAGIFVLPSLFEPWGVVVHEFSLAGFPLLLSNEVGACEQFLTEGENGWSFGANDKYSLCEVLIKAMNTSSERLFEMGTVSYQKGLSYKTGDWCRNILELADQS